LGRKEKTYEIPIDWYTYLEREIPKKENIIRSEIAKYKETIIGEILRYFETREEGDAMDIYLYLIKEGLQVSIEEITDMLESLVKDEILSISADDPIFKKYRIRY